MRSESGLWVEVLPFLGIGIVAELLLQRLGAVLAMTYTRSVQALIDECAESMEAAENLDARVIETLVDAGIFGLMTPAEPGGLDADPATIIDVLSAWPTPTARRGECRWP